MPVFVLAGELLLLFFCFVFLGGQGRGTFTVSPTGYSHPFQLQHYTRLLIAILALEQYYNLVHKPQEKLYTSVHEGYKAHVSFLPSHVPFARWYLLQ